jgi:hypothetical protein
MTLIGCFKPSLESGLAPCPGLACCDHYNLFTRLALGLRVQPAQAQLYSKTTKRVETRQLFRGVRG